MALGPPIVGMPHPAMAGPASVVQAMRGNLTVLGLFQRLFCRVSMGLVWNVYRADLSRAILRYQGALMGRLWHWGLNPPPGSIPALLPQGKAVGVRTFRARRGSY